MPIIFLWYYYCKYYPSASLEVIHSKITFFLYLYLNEILKGVMTRKRALPP